MKAETMQKAVGKFFAAHQKKEEEKNTIVVNLFGAPGSGKSTGAAFIFSVLKLNGVNAELVTEFAKDKLWEQNESVFKCQPYLLGKQCFKISRVCGKVDVIVTDAPIVLPAYYTNDDTRENMTRLALQHFNKCSNLSYFIKRAKPYNPVGRMQTKLEANEIARNQMKWLRDNNIEFKEVAGNLTGYKSIINDILSCLGFESIE